MLTRQVLPTAMVTPVTSAVVTDEAFCPTYWVMGAEEIGMAYAVA